MFFIERVANKNNGKNSHQAMLPSAIIMFPVCDVNIKELSPKIALIGPGPIMNLAIAINILAGLTDWARLVD